MGTLERLNKMFGKRGLPKIERGGEARFTLLSVSPPADALLRRDENDFAVAVSHSEFLVRFDGGTR